MIITGINHLAFITDDMEKTIRFYRDLLAMTLEAGIGHDGYRHYFFRAGNAQVAFFEYDGASPMQRKPHGAMTSAPLGFDHVAFQVESREDLFRLKDRLEAAEVEVSGAVDHGTIWSIYFYDPNNIPLEASWTLVDVVRPPAMAEDQPMAIVAEGAAAGPMAGAEGPDAGGRHAGACRQRASDAGSFVARGTRPPDRRRRGRPRPEPGGGIIFSERRWA